MSIGTFMTPIRYRIERLLPTLVRAHSSKQARVLDHGCGRGAYSQLFTPSNDYTGIDIKARPQWKQYSNDHITYKEMDGTQLEFKDSTFDLVLSITSLEHIPDERKAVREMWRTLKPFGRAIIIVPTKPYWLFQLGRHCYHHNSKRQLLNLITTQPFSILEYKKIGGPASFLFTWADIWLSQAIILPFWLARKAQGKRLESERIENILSKTVHWYINFTPTRQAYYALLRLIDAFDRTIPLLPNHHLVVVEKQ